MELREYGALLRKWLGLIVAVYGSGRCRRLFREQPQHSDLRGLSDGDG